MGRISRTLERLSTEHQEAGELKNDAAKAGCKLIASLPDRSVVTIHGTLRSVTLRPVDGVTALEAELYDGSDSVTLIWLGRRKIEGVAAGRQLKAFGRVGMRGTTRVIYNPRYELDA
ncbi:OB-fold nucleic acid binding domain-containing protein [Aeromicrobium stalagmiti]|uniref:OB-fold nucleic acid binding domain-containing protein n=1 Tax=Aeromicrobium stalagmiti TaxID=2738988 RepID=UPI001568D164|nr:OB-fold nucleic acid binding domain-containing protein [Aeromicrobium stalagmiti]NRQ50878.1 OB-fold nucleic acid binding domain-containing protein [Aeromicrobium stalagmiti]